MEGIKTVGAAVCAVTVITAIFSMLAPSKKLDNVLRFSISLFFLTGLISPFFNQRLDFYIGQLDIDDTFQRSIATEVEDSVLSLARVKLEAFLEKTLEKNGFSSSEVTITLETNHNGDEKNISIKHITVLLNEPVTAFERERLSGLVEGEVGAKPKIYLKDEQTKRKGTNNEAEGF